MLTNPLKDHIFLDIETIPWQAPDAIEQCKALVKVPANYSKPDTIERYMNDNAEKEWLKTSLNGGYGEIICATFAFEDRDVFTLMRSLENNDGYGEADLLRDIWDALGQLEVVNPVWVGHYVGEFDLKFLYHRSVIHGIEPSYRLGPDNKPWAPHIRDTSYMWTGDARSGISLDKLATILGLRSPKELADGSEVWEMVKSGDYQGLAEYNRGDTLTTREVYKRLAFIS